MYPPFQVCINVSVFIDKHYTLTHYFVYIFISLNAELVERSGATITEWYVLCSEENWIKQLFYQNSKNAKMGDINSIKKWGKKNSKMRIWMLKKYPCLHEK